MLRMTARVAKWNTLWKPRAATQLRWESTTSQSDYSPPPPPPPRPQQRHTFWKVLGLSIAVLGPGVIGYAWYDAEFRKYVEQAVPYSKDIFNVFFLSSPSGTLKSPVTTSSNTADGKPLTTKQLAKNKELPTTGGSSKAVKLSLPVESDKERAAWEAREKKEKLEDEIQTKKAAENTALQTGLQSLLDNTSNSVGKAVSSQRAAVKAVEAYKEQLWKAMQAGSTTSQWERVCELEQAQVYAVQEFEKTSKNAHSALVELQRAISKGRANKMTAENNILLTADEEYKKHQKQLQLAASEVEKILLEGRLLAGCRDLVKKGKGYFEAELDELKELLSKTDKQMSATDLNSLIACARHRVTQLHRELHEQSATDPRNVATTHNKQRVDEQRLQADRKSNMSSSNSDAEACAKFEAELRQYLADQATAVNDHLVDALRAQSNEPVEGLKSGDGRNKRKTQELVSEVQETLARFQAIEAAIDDQSEGERSLTDILRSAINHSLYLAAMVLYLAQM